jgi:hypothetical protein
LVEPSQGLGVLVLDLSEINPPLEQRVVHADHPIQTQQSVIKDEVVVVYVVVFVCVNEYHVKLLSGIRQVLEIKWTTTGTTSHQKP